MIDIRLIREDAEGVKARYASREADVGGQVDRLLSLDMLRREAIAAVEFDKAEQNRVSKQIPVMRKNGEDTSGIIALMSDLKEKILTAETELKNTQEEYDYLMLSLPNLPDADLASGGKENNEPIRYFGEPHTFDFPPQHHVDLCTRLGLIDYERGTKLAGSGFWVYRGLGARLEWALLNYFIETHLGDGYELILVPHMLEYECGLTAGQFPKFADEVYKIANPTDDRRHYMLPTAEAALVSLHRDEILTEAELPKKYISYTPCFRREAGSYRADERGMVRGHQFNKVEMVQYTRPEDSDAAFEELVGKAERLVSGLGFHFRTVKLAAGDCSSAMARTYDIEIQIPSMDGYKEVSSVSNARDYQARRGMIRMRREATGKLEFVHTLNGSGLATSRILPALVEQNQQKDGSVVIPEVLRKYLGGLEVIAANG
ncbi:MAG: serine--tRNA ligase [Oscillospiraceae bacterium]|jgi:seryl-tRNA synthetase|nr:serine--tRNA ligase [Oscillospiraceae bacterium]